MIKGLLYLDLTETLIKGLLNLDLAEMSIKGLLYFDLAERSIKGLFYLEILKDWSKGFKVNQRASLPQSWTVAYKKSNVGIRLLNDECFVVPLSFVMWNIPLFLLDLNFFIFSKKTLIDSCNSLKRFFFFLKFEIWNLKLGIESLKIFFFLRKFVSLSLIISKKKISSKSHKFFFWNQYHLFFETLKNFHSSFMIFFFFFLKENRNKIFFLEVDWVNYWGLCPKIQFIGML